MELYRKLALLADAAKYDASCPGGAALPDALGGGPGIAFALGPEDRVIPVLKLLLTNQCVLDCHFCVHRASNQRPRASFTPEEVCGLTLDAYRHGYVEGLFLSSGIFPGPDATMEGLGRVARMLRAEHGFQGFIQLVAPPGADPALLQEAGRWADRISVNVEFPDAGHLLRLAPGKTLESIEAALQALPDPAGSTTQMLVGAGPATDREILAATARIYRDHGLHRIFYSAYVPVPGADPDLPLLPPPFLRVTRLEQADHLMRRCGFEADELTSPGQPDLELDIEPKLAWALRRRELFPVDVARAPKELLLRIPGIDEPCLALLLELRRRQKPSLADLGRLGIDLRQAHPFILTADPHPDPRLLDRFAPSRPRQLDLF